MQGVPWGESGAELAAEARGNKYTVLLFHIESWRQGASILPVRGIRVTIDPAGRSPMGNSDSPIMFLFQIINKYSKNFICIELCLIISYDDMPMKEKRERMWYYEK